MIRIVFTHNFKKAYSDVKDDVLKKLIEAKLKSLPLDLNKQLQTKESYKLIPQKRYRIYYRFDKAKGEVQILRLVSTYKIVRPAKSNILSIIQRDKELLKKLAKM